MRQLSKLETVIMLVGGLLMVVGAGGTMFLQSWAAYVFAPGALMFSAMQMRQAYEGTNFTIRRLRRLLLVSDVLFLLAALLMMLNQSNFIGISQLAYVQYVHNNWIVVLLVAAILQLYASHRIANELEKEAKKR
jgi:phosphatidylglycerophosphate synthase